MEGAIPQIKHRNILENDTEALAQKIKHMIKFWREEKWYMKFRFSARPIFAYWAFNILYRRRLLGHGSFCIKQNLGEANLSFTELKEMLSSGNYTQIMSKLMHYAKNVTGTNAYWNKEKRDLRATITPNYILDFISCRISLA